MTNIDCIEAFIDRTGPVSSMNMMYVFHRLFTYKTPLAMWKEDGRVLVNANNYSKTSSTHRSMLLRNLRVRNIKFDYTYDTNDFHFSWE